MADSDKYPTSSGRRRFVKGVVGSASLAAVGTASAITVDSLTNPSGAGGGITQFFGVENVDGPAPRAMPMIPIQIDGEGFISGVYPEVSEETVQGQTVTVVEQELGGITYSANWFQYCGVQSYEGVQPSYEGDNYFRYSGGAQYEWQQSEVSAGDRVNIDDFSDYTEWGNEIGQAGLGKPAMATWRSQDTEDTLPVQLIRSARIERAVERAGGAVSEWLSAATSQGMMAILNKCTHFCCVPGFKTSEQSIQFNAADDIYCPCHQSVYNPFSIVQRSFVAFPRPEED